MIMGCMSLPAFAADKTVYVKIALQDESDFTILTVTGDEDFDFTEEYYLNASAIQPEDQGDGVYSAALTINKSYSFMVDSNPLLATGTKKDLVIVVPENCDCVTLKQDSEGGNWSADWSVYGEEESETPAVQGFYQDTENPNLYHITSLEGLKQFRDSVNNGTSYSGETIQLDEDIDLSGENWTPIGRNGVTFNGTFNGNSHKIENLTINDDSLSEAGLFGQTMGATIQNITIENVTLAAQSKVGALVGFSNGANATFTNCSVTGTIQIAGTSSVGGLIGNISEGKFTLTGCSVDGTNAENRSVTGTNMVGGLVGNTLYAGTITNCSVSNVTVSSPKKLGGLVGQILYSKYPNATDYNAPLIISDVSVSDVTVDCTATADTDDYVQVGGLIGILYRSDGVSSLNQVSIAGTVSDVTVNAIESSKKGAAVAGLATGGYRKLSAAGSAAELTEDGVEFDVNYSGTNTINGNTNYTSYKGIYNPAPVTYVAQIGSTKYVTLAEAFEAAESGDTITLLADVKLTGTAEADRLCVTKSITLDMDGKTISFDESVTDAGSNFAVLWVLNGATLTLTGNGTIDGSSAEAYGINLGYIQKKSGETVTREEQTGNLVVESGTIKGDVSAIQIQVGTAEISGGYFEVKPYNDGKDPYRYTLNCIDASFKAGKAVYSVTGGSFYKFDPSDSASENPAGVFTANGYAAYKTGDKWIVTEDNKVAEIDGVFYGTLPEAIEAAESGATITLLKDIDLGSASLTIGKALTLTSDGVAKTIASSAAQAILLTGNGNVTLEKVNVTATKGHGIQAGNDSAAYSGQLTLDGATLTVAKRGIRVYKEDTGFGIALEDSTIQSNVADPKKAYTTGNDAMGLSLGTTDDKGYTVTITDSTIQGFSYCINSVMSGSNLNVTMTGGATYGRAALNVWGSNNTFTMTDVDIHGLNIQTGPTEGFACIVDNTSARNNTYEINQCKFYAFLSEAANNTETSTASEQMFDLRGYGSKMFINGNVTAYVAKVGNTDADASNGRFGLMYSEGCLMYNLVVLDRSAMNDLAAEIAALSDDVDKIQYGEAQYDLTRLTYTTEVLYCWYTGNQMKGVYCDFNVPFTSAAYKLCDGGLIRLQKNVELTQNLTANVSFSLILDTYSITAGNYRIQIAAGATVTTDKQATGLFSVPEGYELVETKIPSGYTYRAFVQQSTSNDTTKQEQVNENTTKTTTTNFTMSAGADADDPSFAIKTEVTTTTTGENASSNTTTTFRPVEVATSAAATAPEAVKSDTSNAAISVVAAITAYNDTKATSESATFKAALSDSDNATPAKVLKTTAAANAIAKAAANVSAAEISEAKVILKTELRSFETTDNSNNVKKVVYDIKPVAQLYNANGESLGEAVKLLNDDIAEGETFTFEIPVPSAMTASDIKVSHKGESGYSTEVGTYTPAGEVGTVRYITVTVDHFSEFELEEDTLVLGTAKVTANLTLEDEIRINFSVSQLSKDASNYYVTYQFAGETEPHIAYFNNTTMVSSGIYKFTVADCAAKQMTDKVNFKVYYDGVMVYNFDYSIRDYCVRMIKNSNDQKLKALCRAILDYGASAQTYFGYRTDALANADGYGKYDSNAIPAVDNTNTNNVIALDLPSLGNGIRSVNANLTLVSKTEMNFMLNVNDTQSISDCTVTSSDQQETVSTSMTTSGNIVTIKVNGIAAKNLNHAYTLTFQCGDQENSITYSPLTYAYRSQNKAAGLGYLSKALYQYWFTAQQYFSK